MEHGGRSPRVIHQRDWHLYPNAVYVGRPSKWGNPYVIGRDGTRAEVIEKYRAYILASTHLLESLHELTGKDLVCWCAPLSCHADVLIELANNDTHRGLSKFYRNVV